MQIKNRPTSHNILLKSEVYYKTKHVVFSKVRDKSPLTYRIKVFPYFLSRKCCKHALNKIIFVNRRYHFPRPKTWIQKKGENHNHVSLKAAAAGEHSLEEMYFYIIWCPSISQALEEIFDQNEKANKFPVSL